MNFIGFKHIVEIRGPWFWMTIFRVLHYQIYSVVYLRYRSISCGVTLLQVWDWVHISISKLVIHVDLYPEEPYTYRYTPDIGHRGLGNTLYWRYQIDILQHFIWRPYLDFPGWADDDQHLPFCRQQRFLIGRIVETQRIIEMYFVGHVQAFWGGIGSTYYYNLYFSGCFGGI